MSTPIFLVFETKKNKTEYKATFKTRQLAWGFCKKQVYRDDENYDEREIEEEDHERITDYDEQISFYIKEDFIREEIPEKIEKEKPQLVFEKSKKEKIQNFNDIQRNILDTIIKESKCGCTENFIIKKLSNYPKKKVIENIRLLEQDVLIYEFVHKKNYKTYATEEDLCQDCVRQYPTCPICEDFDTNRSKVIIRCKNHKLKWFQDFFITCCSECYNLGFRYELNSKNLVEIKLNGKIIDPSELEKPIKHNFFEQFELSDKIEI